MAMTRGFTARGNSKKAEKAFLVVRNMLHGRKRSDRRAQFRSFMAKLEKEGKGRIRRAVTTLTGRSSKGGFAMDSVVHQGVTVTDQWRWRRS